MILSAKSSGTMKLATSLLLFFTVVMLGTFGYMIIEGWSFSNALFMTVITLSTVGYGEIEPLDGPGRMLTGAIIFLGAGVVAYTLGTFTSYFFGGQVIETLRGRRMEKQIRNLKNHIIVAGYGKLGKEITEELLRNKVDFCVVELNPAHVKEAREHGCLIIEGDAGEDDTLEQAGISRAYGLTAALTGDTANVMVTITARNLNPDLVIAARGIDTGSRAKLTRAGANRVELPFKIAGRRLADMVLKPKMLEFFDLFYSTFSSDLQFTEFSLEDGGKLPGKTLAEADIRRVTGGAVVMAVRHEDGEIALHPQGDYRFRTGDMLMVMGNREQIERFSDKYKLS